MRLDYVLYVLAVVFFAVTAVSFAVVSDETARNLYAISTVVVGLLFVGVGFLLRPKVKTAASAPPEPAPPSPPAPSAPSVPPQAAIVEAPVAIVSKTETPLMEKPVAETRIAEAPAATKATPAAQVSAPATEVPAEETAATAQATELTKIRGINEKRADQLKANGIKSVEDLANASAADLAAKLAVSEKIVKMWIGSAKKMVK